MVVRAAFKGGLLSSAFWIASSSEIRTEPCAWPDGTFCGEVCCPAAFCCSGVCAGNPCGERVSCGVDGAGACCPNRVGLALAHTNRVSTAGETDLRAISFNLERENESPPMCCE